MTGWQSGGDPGGWNQNQPFGPEAQTSRYNDPYGGSDPYQYGSDPYSGNQYGADPYGSDPYGSGGYDPYGQQQQYPPTGGFPAPGFGPPPPPPKRSKLPMILSLVAVVIIVGAVVAILLVNRNGDQPVAQEDNKSSTTAPSSKTSTPTSKSGGGDHGDWISIDNSADAGMSYQVPGDWKESENKVDTGLGVKFSGGAEYGSYECEGSGYIRTFVGSGDVEGKNGKDLDLASTMKDFAKSFATTYYGEDAQVDVPTPKETKVDGKTAMTLTAKVKQNVTKPNCQATDGEIAMVGILLEQDGRPAGVSMLVVVNDTAGGPDKPKPLDPSVSQDILGTVKTK